MDMARNLNTGRGFIPNFGSPHLKLPTSYPQAIHRSKV